MIFLGFVNFSVPPAVVPKLFCFGVKLALLTNFLGTGRMDPGELAGAVGVKRDSSRHEEEVQAEETQSARRGRRRPLGDLKWLHGMLRRR